MACIIYLAARTLKIKNKRTLVHVYSVKWFPPLQGCSSLALEEKPCSQSRAHEVQHILAPGELYKML